ncbi:MAG TPA: hypothetical protein DDW83_01810 [Peptococcaceae bacterium]|nr:hypothetical protein [Peptococcaceae bacterium]
MKNNNEKIEIDKELYDILRCLVVALMNKYCENETFILTREQRTELVGSISLFVKRELLDNLDEKYSLFPPKFKEETSC